MIALGDSGSLPARLGRYELITRIGQGGMAEVQLALQRGPAGFEKLVVVKLVHENLASQKPFVDMLLDEARLAALVKHPNVVDIYDLGEADGRYFIAMEYLEGEPLLAVLRAGRDGQRLDPLSTARLIADTAEGLDAAHELRSMAGDPIELIHHDISLGNIVVLYNGQVKLVDFGVAKASQSAAARLRVQGKFGYMAPEKLRGESGDRRSDIWSLGCVLWEALTLRRLFKGGNDSETMQQVFDLEIAAPSSINGDVPRQLDPIVLRALSRDPGRRYPTAKAMAAELEAALHEHGYAAKNDAIARYMQSTFADHIAARKKLLQEVSSKGRPSADVLEAAFNLGVLASGSPVTGGDGLSGKIALPRTRRLSDPPPIPAAARAQPVAPPAEVAGSDGPTVPEPPRARPRRRWWIAAAGAGVLTVAVAALAILRHGDGDGAGELFAPAATITAPPEVAVAPASPEPPAVVAAADPPASAADRLARDDRSSDVAPVRADDTSGRAAPAPAGGDATPRPSRPRRTAATRAAQAARPVERVDPDELFREGVQAWMRGEARAALALCRRVTHDAPGFGPAWRLMGLVHERLGERASARTAFEKYLQLSPGAGDAGDIRQRLDAL